MNRYIARTILKKGLSPIVPLFDYTKSPKIKWSDKESWITNENCNFKRYSDKTI